MVPTLIYSHICAEWLSQLPEQMCYFKYANLKCEYQAFIVANKLDKTDNKFCVTD